MQQAENRLRKRVMAIAIEDQDQSELVSFVASNHSSYLSATAHFASGRVVNVREKLSSEHQ